MRLVLALLSLLLPWSIRRRLLNRAFGYEIHPDARIGVSLVLPARSLVMGPHARIGHLNIIRSLDEVHLDAYAFMGSMNWVTANLAGYRGPGSEGRITGRNPRLFMGRHALITSRHYFDCSDSVEILAYSSVGGIRTVWQTHNFDMYAAEQACQPIRIGPTAFVGSSCLLLGGASLPEYTLLAAGSVLIGPKSESYRLYAGNPAVEKKTYPEDYGWFNRTDEWLVNARSHGHRWSQGSRT